MKALHIVTFILVLVGALNWGFVALFSFNLVSAVFGSMPELEKLVYVLVAASAVYVFVSHKKDCKICK